MDANMDEIVEQALVENRIENPITADKTNEEEGILEPE
jgi:hypothetical protein